MTRFSLPDDPVVLRMENDLLAMENDHLRGRMERGVPSAAVRDQLREMEAELARSEEHLAVERERVAELAQARSDLRWLLQRFEGTPARLLLRRFSGYRLLVDRWLGS